MVTTAQNEKCYEYRGLSTDKKPTDDSVCNGTVFFEMDTSKVFIFDSQNKTWLPSNPLVMSGVVKRGF